jgi:methylated-DNA-[protein]-cysteine S-methyltransferase
MPFFDRFLEIVEDEKGISNLSFTDVNDAPLVEPNATMLELMEYAEGKRRTFTRPLMLKGTSFQKAVWDALLAIPYGETRSYQQIAEYVNSPKALRAVGQACHVNPIGIIVPCHRVIGKNGQLTGYAGGLDYKVLLLKHEKMG